MPSRPPRGDEDLDYRGCRIELRRLWMGWRIAVPELEITRHGIDRGQLIEESKHLVDQHIDASRQ
jgi:hypothetical protein